MTISWSQEFSLNDELIDAQHASLFECLNILSEMIDIEKKQTNFLLADFLEEFLHFAKIHFRDEESLLLARNIPQEDIERHAIEHASYINRMSFLHNNIENRSFDETAEALAELTQWWLHHFFTHDVILKTHD